jgi:BirA family biotin operon repressor/biotin-[acetyl-CoA-carboxylase] ligase
MSELFANPPVVLEEVNSTNNYISGHLDQMTEGSVIVAKAQIAGRGQGKNFWESEPGLNLTFSVLLTPTFLRIQDQFYLSKVISLAVADFVSLYADNVSVKWPNDIYIGHKKVSGILIENSVFQDFMQSSIVGIGINVNQTIFRSGAPNPVSISQLTGETYDLNELLDILLDLIDFRYQMLKEHDFDTIDQLYFDFLYRRNKLTSFKADDVLFKGTIVGVEPTGELIIRDEAGQMREFLYKEVEYVL